MKMNKLSAIIVEDEKAAQKALQSYIEKYCPDLEIIGIANNGKEGIRLIEESNPEIVFLDVEMPHANAFDLLDATTDYSFQTIFVTAYSEYAIKALNMSAAYYLLKPINIEELITAVEKVSETIRSKNSFNSNQWVKMNFQNSQHQQLVLPTMSGFDVLPIDSVIRLKGNGNFTNVYTKDGKEIMVCRFLKHFETILPEHFLRVHKSHIINKLMIKSYNKSGFITLQDNSEIEISSTYRDTFLMHFK